MNLTLGIENSVKRVVTCEDSVLCFGGSGSSLFGVSYRELNSECFFDGAVAFVNSVIENFAVFFFGYHNVPRYSGHLIGCQSFEEAEVISVVILLGQVSRLIVDDLCCFFNSSCFLNRSGFIGRRNAGIRTGITAAASSCQKKRRCQECDCCNAFEHDVYSFSIILQILYASFVTA